MAWDKGFNFRLTTGYVTDGTNETYVYGGAGSDGEVYPVTRNGVTFGWLTNTLQPRDRNASNDRRLAGIQFDSGGFSTYFRVDLPATGDYTIRASFGDESNTSSINSKFQDTTTDLATVSGSTGAANSFLDAAGTVRTQAAWPGSNTALTKTFATTQFRMKNNATSSPITHIFLSQVITTSRGMPFGHEGTAFNGGRTFAGLLR